VTAKIERGACRFVATKMDKGNPIIKLELFHDTVSHLRAISIGFELLGGVTLDQARTLVDAMNERIIEVIIAPK
jgi:hypothetical protein